MALRVVMMGTGTFALPTFQTLIKSQHTIAALVTQPDRAGTGHHQHLNPLKELALSRQIPVLQPEKANTPENLDQLRQLQADLFVVAAYGQLLSAELLSIPRLGAINLHGSLLPRYRGAAPVQYAVWNGDTETGVTIFQIEPRLDAGPVLGVVKTDIGPRETSGQLHDRLAELAAPLTLEVLHHLEAGTGPCDLQNSSLVTKAPRIRKEQGLIPWERSSQEISWHVRAMQPWPMPYTFLHLPDRQPVRMLILEIDILDDTSPTAAAPGTVLVRNGEILVRTGSGQVRINALQPAGKRAMTSREFLCGTPLTAARFGHE